MRAGTVKTDREAWEDEMGELLEGRPSVGAIRPTKLRYTHEAVIDMILAEPGVSQGKLAATFGYTQG